ncbi:hypothetical protein Tco_1205132 [Tanacetum coccineum]
MLVRYMGGFWVLLEFNDSHARNKFKDHSRVNSWFSEVRHWYKEFVVDERLLWVNVEGIPSIGWTPKTFNKIEERKEGAANGVTPFVNERAEQDDTLHLKKVDSLPKLDDPFWIYDLLNKKHEANAEPVMGDPLYPPGFTPSLVLDGCINYEAMGTHLQNESNHATSPLAAPSSIGGGESKDIPSGNKKVKTSNKEDIVIVSHMTSYGVQYGGLFKEYRRNYFFSRRYLWVLDKDHKIVSALTHPNFGSSTMQAQGPYATLSEKLDT